MFKLPLFLSIEEYALKNLTEKFYEVYGNISSKKIFVMTSEHIFEMVKEDLAELLEMSSMSKVFYVKDNSFDNSVEIAKQIVMEEYDVVIGIGGGKILDTAKYASYVGKKTYFAIPTTLSNDGISSPIAVLKTNKGKAKSFGCKSPDGIIVDLSFIKNGPIELIEAGIGDTVSNYTALYDWKLSKSLSDATINDFSYLLSDTAFNMIARSSECDIKSSEFLKQLAEALILGGLAMDISGNSRPCSGSEHLFSHSLDENYNVDVPHGLKVALGSITSCILQGRDYKIILELLNRYNINISPKAMGISKEIFVDAWLKAKNTRPERFTILNCRELNKKILNEIYDKILEDVK